MRLQPRYHLLITLHRSDTWCTAPVAHPAIPASHRFYIPLIERLITIPRPSIHPLRRPACTAEMLRYRSRSASAHPVSTFIGRSLIMLISIQPLNLHLLLSYAARFDLSRSFKRTVHCGTVIDTLRTTTYCRSPSHFIEIWLCVIAIRGISQSAPDGPQTSGT